MNARELGTKGEVLACRFFENKGFEILSKNFRFGRTGEIDLIVRKGNLIVFVEVKNRRTDLYGGALYAISPSKIKKLKVVAEAFLRLNPDLKKNPNLIFRFDLLAIHNDNCEWVEDIFR
ncbi:MAG: YraN family protein [Spirochaetes bacterium]|nr:YraN family protein [Spirochaetota bacterium]